MIKKLIYPNSGFTHAELILIYKSGDIVFNLVNIDENMNIVRKDTNLVAQLGKYPFKITDEEFFELITK